MATGSRGAAGLQSWLHFNDMCRHLFTNKGAVSLNYPEPKPHLAAYPLGALCEVSGSFACSSAQ